MGSTRPAPCHPERTVHARELCESCYRKWLHADRPDVAQRKRDRERKRYSERGKVRNQQVARRYYLSRTYGLTVEEAEALGTTCMICGAEAQHIDHDHATGKVRGVLCRPCNLGLGYFGDNTESLANAITYLGGK